MGVNPVSISKTAISALQSGVVSNAVRGAAQKESTPTINLIRFLKKGLHNFEQVDGIVLRLPDEKKMLGVLPENWRKLFATAELPQKTKEVHNILYDFAKKFQKTEGSLSESNLTIQNFAKKLGDFLKIKTEVSYVDEGMFGSVVRIKGGKEDLALKVFHEIPETVEPYSMSAYKRHGQTMELQNAIALTHGLKPSQRARFYMGRITSLGEDGGYMLSEFVSPSKMSGMELSAYTPREDFTYSRFLFGDRLKRGNIMDGKILDFGDVSYRFPNKEQEKIAKEIFPLICNGETQKLAAIKKHYKNNPNFDAVVNKSSSNIVYYLSYPFNLVDFMKAKGAKEVLSSINALGVDFPQLKTYKAFKPEEINFLKSVGILQ